ncbi:tetratricopeptide repeat protein [Thiosulfatihalobacter marinus]|uniref:tetratricopeptide repeat protein n=1 Tax=Thiosulfatihalobacter marinus TaxID=2792481 RepID=UPI0018D5D3CA|nr:tetratricopeptide repeat protein [Thiosulfatihalobacter marinus]
MALQDGYSNDITTTSSRARDAYDRGVQLFLAAQFGPVAAFGQCVQADPGFALGHAALARARMMGGDMPGAQAAIATATGLGSNDRREAQHIAAMATLLAGNAAETRRLVLAHVRDFPRDALVAQLCSSVFGLIGFSGKIGREADLLAYTTALLPHYGEDWWMMSMHSVALCETGQADAALTLMDRALALNPANANGAHFKAHAQYEAGGTHTGRAFLDDWMQGYDSRGLLHGHLSWHAALWALHDGDAAGMWRALDGGAVPGAGHSLPLNVLTDTAAMYHRAELAGIAVDPARWAALSDYAAQYFPTPGQSFADIHAALSHAMAGQGDRLAVLAEAGRGYAGDLVGPVARAWGAMARGDWGAALADLTPVMAQTERLGGSRAQRDLLELTWANLLLKLGLTDEAHRALRTRRPMLADAPPVAGWG